MAGHRINFCAIAMRRSCVVNMTCPIHLG
jgi:hypothetical protein